MSETKYDFSKAEKGKFYRPDAIFRSSVLFGYSQAHTRGSHSMDHLQYRKICASDVVRDRMALELWLEDKDNSRQIAEVFYSDTTNEFTVTLYETNVPMALIEDLIAEAKVKLPPSLLEKQAVQ